MKAKAIVKICICGTIALVLASVLVSLLAIPRVLDWKIGDLSLVSWMSAGSPAA